MPNKYITFDQTGELRVKLQNGPVKEAGENGAQIDDVIAFAKEFIENHNNKFPCRENSLAITKLDESLMWLQRRKEDRERRGVEGYSKK